MQKTHGGHNQYNSRTTAFRTTGPRTTEWKQWGEGYYPGGGIVLLPISMFIIADVCPHTVLEVT